MNRNIPFLGSELLVPFSKTSLMYFRWPAIERGATDTPLHASATVIDGKRVEIVLQVPCLSTS